MLAPVNPTSATHSRSNALGFVLSNWGEVRTAADELSKSGLIPDYLRGKPADVLVILLQGSALGLDPITALTNIYVVKGRPFMASLMRQAIVRNSVECEYIRIIESTAKQCTVETKRRGDPAPVRQTYTYAMAELSGITNQNQKYRTEPDVMLKRRAMSRLLEDVYPDVLRGLGDRDEDPGALEVLQRADAAAMAKTAPPPSEVKKKPVPVSAEPAPEEAHFEEPAPAEPVLTEPLATAGDGFVEEHPAFVRLAAASSKAEIDEASKLGGKELPKGHALRDAFAVAVSNRRRDVEQGR